MSETPGPSPEETGAVAPEIFRQRKRSENPVIAPEAVKKRDSAIVRTVGDASFIVRKGSSPAIYDREGEEVELPNNALDMAIADWSGIKSSLGISSSDLRIIQNSGDAPAVGDYIGVNQLPDKIKPFVSKMVDTAAPGADGLKEIGFPNESWKVTTDDLSKVQVDIDDDYVLVGVSGTESYIAYMRREGGMQLEARNWKRVDSLTAAASTIPYKLRQAIDNLRDPSITGTFHVASGSLTVTEDGLSFRRPGSPPFQDNVPDVGNNVCEDRNDNGDPNGSFFYASEGGLTISKLDPNRVPPQAQRLNVPAYRGIQNLQVDATGNFLTFESEGKFIVLDKGELEAGNVIEVASTDKIFHAALDSQGKVRGIGEDGKLEMYDTNFQNILDAIEDRKRAAAVEQARLASRTDEEKEKDEQQALRDKYIGRWGERIAEETSTVQAATTLNGITEQRDRLRRFADGLASTVPGEELDFLRKEFDLIVGEKEREIAVAEVGDRIGRLGGLVRLAEPWDTLQFDVAKNILARLQDLRGRHLIHEETAREALRELEGVYAMKTNEFRDQQSKTLVQTIDIARRQVSDAVGKLSSYRSLMDWVDEGGVMSAIDLEFGRIMDRFKGTDGSIDPSIENEFIRARGSFNSIIKERQEALRELEAERGASPEEVREAKIAGFRDEIAFILDFIESRGLTSRGDIDITRDGNTRYQQLKKDIEDMQATDPTIARQLRRIWGTSYAMYIADVERQQTAGSEDEYGRQMIAFGETRLPVREAPRKSRKTPSDVKLIFMPDPEFKPKLEGGEVIQMGEIGVELTFENGKGKTKVVQRRLYQGKNNEDELRFGVETFMDAPIPGTVVTNVEFNKIQKEYKDWERGERSRRGKEAREEKASLSQTRREQYLQRPVFLADDTEVTLQDVNDLAKEYSELKDAQNSGSQVDEARIADIELKMPDLPRRRLVKERKALQAAQDKGETIDLDRLAELDSTLQGMQSVRNWRPATESDAYGDWEADYMDDLEGYAEYVAKHHLTLFSRIKELSNSPDTEEPSDFGYIPTWKDTWTRDEQTSNYLAQIAYRAQRQRDRKQGVISLEGDAGTGKDVLIEMFACELKRPIFTFDASKWTRESDFTEQITMENGNVVKIPTTFLRGLETPGSIVYINEFNTMPEDVQVFLNSLFDAKRQLTLKTSAGELIKVHPDVLLFSSMNPGYRGTFDPQEATRSRQDPIIIDYPALTKLKDPTDPSSGRIFNSADALRIARETDSLVETTFDLNPEHNEFVKIWDQVINGIDRGIDESTLTTVQKYDLYTILALVEFTDKLRTAFRNRLNIDDMSSFVVDQPIGRELGNCAYDLSYVSEQEKNSHAASVNTAAEAQAKKLLLDNYLPKVLIFKAAGGSNVEVRERIETEIQSWSLQTTP